MSHKRVTENHMKFRVYGVGPSSPLDMAHFGAFVIFLGAGLVALSSWLPCKRDSESQWDSWLNKVKAPNHILPLCANCRHSHGTKLSYTRASSTSVVPTSNPPLTPSPNRSDVPTPNTTTTKPDNGTSSAQPSQATPDDTSITPFTPPPPPPPLSVSSFSVEVLDIGLQVNVNDSGIFNVTVFQSSQRIFSEMVNDTKRNITNLKPCTKYEVTVQRRGGVTCSKSGDNSSSVISETTGNMKKGHFKYAPQSIGKISFTSDWNISCADVSSLRGTAEQCENDKRCCIPVEPDDLCTNLSITFNSSKCPFNDSVHLDAGKFHKVLDLTQNVTYPKNSTTGNPVKIVPKMSLPPKCNFTIDYYCTDKNNKTKNISELQPFENYICRGIIKNVTQTPEIPVNTTCVLKKNYSNPTKSDTSITLNWNTESENCDINQIQPRLNYVCRCRTVYGNSEGVPSETNSQSCTVTGLEAFTKYNCEVKGFYDEKSVFSFTETGIKTEPGVPDKVELTKVDITENNVFTVTCKMPDGNKFKGKKEEFRATLLLEDKEIKTKPGAKCSFTFEGLNYLTTYKVKVQAFNGFNYGEASEETVITLFNDKAVIGFLVLLILITAVALLLVLYKIYVLKHRKSRNLGDHHQLLPIEEERLLNIDPIPGDELLDTYKRKLADEGRLFLAEFQSIPRIFSKYTMKEAKKNCNAIKNRYVDILPYDYNRVQLTTGNGEQGCDYINASFIDGYNEAKKYIAAQGPKEETIGDFWRMVWEQKSSVIVMVTRCEEGNRVKCAQYWPSLEREAEIFEEFVVKVNSEDQCPDYTIRHLSLTNKREKNSEREVTHIQFLSWPDHGVPGEPHLLLKLRRRVNAFKNLFSGPIVVHCSAGVGRTGTYIGIDAMMEGLDVESRVDIYGYVVQLRRQRCLMVQVEAQYILIHQALLEHNQFGETEISLSDLHNSVSALKENAGDESSLMVEEFERLPSYKNWRTYNTGITEENNKKNWVATVIPYDYNRVLLRLEEEDSQDGEDKDEDDDESSDEEEEESSKYINASHISGYWGSRCFITAQTPFSDTTADFWLMIHQKKVSTIVMLSESKQGETESAYWGKEKTTYGEIEVEVSSTEMTPVFISRTMNIRHVKRKEGRAVKHFEFLKWSDGDLPQKPQELMELLKEIRSKCDDSRSLRASPALVHCNNGSTALAWWWRCGTCWTVQRQRSWWTCFKW
ncbi:hypothetical protein WMY93_024170 [Mugilogobius chulae]|uniref:protein-tyrosine-phosphatase n=1 Tax=Mugilogobius chulae TaxID=88201 RepID=A0AAW0MYV8_9GOBI